MKSLAFIHRNDTRFAVGDFYPVLSVFSYHELGNTLSPFLLLDHLGPGKIAPSMKRRGVNDHPHRGFETVTLVYAGELEHKDSSGGGGSISAGDVQWMTAGAGVIHRELFSEEFSKSGGTFEMIQLWVNLPAADKMNSPRYQSLKKAEIPVVKLENEAGFVRIIAGRFNHVIGPALTHTPITLLDIELRAGQQAGFPAQSGETTLVYLRSGRAQFQKDEEVLEEQGLAVMSNQGEHLSITALQSCKLLILTGQPITEPINGHGPFVMNTYDEILQAYDDIKNGRFAK
ncbi:pirin family protein [Acinetobacter baumannii]|uniref:pirin family protein n=1 Tax=Acinetobacter baumannii TaxID=470 RepID=UPI000810F094|nr:pirin family protein [Acinetobacter baumannii]MDC4314827.1 pirin family protein [Acinetobacter baumannii]MDC4359774.1 pirin family protein [Acinetobacter baumannii]MDC5187649.1 pirin family protein [Acinetobacter baumannii]MDC5341663.1 pirin family protein [Acinetobacter baumannii]MDC5470119.1 pirin family protein [Acinetobacter baumannii]